MASPAGRKPAVEDFREIFELPVAPLPLLVAVDVYLVVTHYQTILNLIHQFR